MDPAILPLVTLVLGAIFGGVACWFIASRPVADLRARLAVVEREADEQEGEFKRAIAGPGDSAARGCRAQKSEQCRWACQSR